MNAALRKESEPNGVRFYLSQLNNSIIKLLGPGKENKFPHIYSNAIFFAYFFILPIRLSCLGNASGFRFRWLPSMTFPLMK